METGIQKEDLKILAEMGRALWMDPHESQTATAETLCAVSLLALTPERALERAASALLERVSSRGVAANLRANLDAGLGIGQPFYRLNPEERFLLIALHLGRWSYARVSRILAEPQEQVEARAWSARLKFAAFVQLSAYPSGASAYGTHCPPYDPKTPWTQRFMDEEIASGRERVFFQNHLMACTPCRDALGRCREMYYALEQAMPKLTEDDSDRGLLRSLEAISKRSVGTRSPASRSFGESLVIFSRRWDIRFVLATVAVAALIRIFRG